MYQEINRCIQIQNSTAPRYLSAVKRPYRFHRMTDIYIPDSRYLTKSFYDAFSFIA